jgi:hypothetical protein
MPFGIIAESRSSCPGFPKDFYAGEVGRPGLSPGIDFRLQMVGYFEGIDSERGIARAGQR